MIACLVDFGDLPAVILLGFAFFELCRVARGDIHDRRAVRALDRAPATRPPNLRLVRPGPYDWREESRAEPKGTPPGRTSR